MNYLPIPEYLPHRPPMVLIDRIVEAAETHIVCEVALKVDSPFCDGAAVPGWVGIEYMAQTIGVLSGWRSLAKQLPVKIGFLVGTRRYQSHVPHFRAGDVLRITADEEASAENGVSIMRCALHDLAGTLLAEATLTAFHPNDLDAFVRQSASDHATENASALQ